LVSLDSGQLKIADNAAFANEHGVEE